MKHPLISAAVTVVAIAGVFAMSHSARAADDSVVDKVKARIPTIIQLAATPAIVSACKAQNAAPSAEVQAMTQDKWKALPVLDGLVRALTKNDAAAALKAKKDETVAEAFVSSASGAKVAFLAKTTSWSHKGKPKHEKPMAGAQWIGEVETDESTGQQQIQVAVPVLDDGKPIGSLVVGLSISKL